jgi:hypothetical protein
VRSLLRPLTECSAWAQQVSWGRARQVKALFCPLFARSECGQATTMLAGTKGEGAYLATDRLVGVGSISHGGSGKDS